MNDNLDNRENNGEASLSNKTTRTVAKGAADAYTGGQYSQIKNSSAITKAAGDKLEEKVGKVGDKLNKASGGKLEEKLQKVNDKSGGAVDKVNDNYDNVAGAVTGSPGAGSSFGKNMQSPSGGSLDKLNHPNGNSDLMNKSNSQALDGDGLDDSKNKDKSNSKKSSLDDNTSGKSNSSLDDNIDNDTSDDSGKFSFDKNKKILLFIGIGMASLLGLIVVISVAVGVLFSPIDVFNKFVNGVKDFFTTTDQEKEERFYKAVKDEVASVSKQFNLCIDPNLVIAALTVEKDYYELTGINEESEENVNLESSSAIETNEDNSADKDFKFDYKKMKKYIKLLSYMQVKRKVYKSINILDFNPATDCVDGGKLELINDTNVNRTTGARNSTNADFVSQNDQDNIFLKFFQTKASEELNQEYYLYYPDFTTTTVNVTDSNGNVVTDANGNVQTTTTKVCEYKQAPSPNPDKELSFGTGFEDRENGVFYWNLVHQFIPDYYKDYLPEDETSEEYHKKVISMADEVYELYQTVGPGVCLKDEAPSGISYSNSSYCPGGVTVEGVGIYDLEDYLVGVLAGEAYLSENMEALKAQAVAARTYVLVRTNGCKKSIRGNANDQSFEKTTNEKAKRAVEETKGEVLKYNGQLFLSEYDSFCYEDSGCPEAKKNSDGTYTVTYTKQPLLEKNEITLSESKYYKWIVPGKGHSRGMSQLLSYQLANEGLSYDEILRYFYSDGVVLSKSTGANLTTATNIADRPISQILTENGSSIEEFNSYIASSVSSAGFGTREGVVAAATSLIQGFEERTGLKLPYKWGGTRYGVSGAVSTWARGASSEVGSGLDCSGFISWAVYNGGYNYDSRVSGIWAEAGTRRKWTYGMYDNSALPGDLLASSGHIQMIVGVTDTGYLVAEASCWAIGLRIRYLSFTSKGTYELVDMSNYYATRPTRNNNGGNIY